MFLLIHQIYVSMCTVQAMQAAARAAAVAATGSLGANLPVVPDNSYQQANGLVLATGVPQNLSNPQPGENAALWTGASLPVVTNQSANGVSTSTGPSMAPPMPASADGGFRCSLNPSYRATTGATGPTRPHG